jgi:hypothetical protein
MQTANQPNFIRCTDLHASKLIAVKQAKVQPDVDARNRVKDAFERNQKESSG